MSGSALNIRSRVAPFKHKERLMNKKLDFLKITLDNRNRKLTHVRQVLTEEQQRERGMLLAQARHGMANQSHMELCEFSLGLVAAKLELSNERARLLERIETVKMKLAAVRALISLKATTIRVGTQTTTPPKRDRKGNPDPLAPPVKKLKLISSECMKVESRLGYFD